MATGKRTDREQSHESPSDAAARANPDAPMTDNQVQRLRVLSQEVGEAFDENRPMTAAETERRIEELQERAGYGQSPPRPDAVP
jgi:hypothetical protein